jgi:hypothetical protein
MPAASRAAISRVARLAETRPGLVARLRLFGLLILLVPLFGGLQALLEEGVPRVEIRIVPRDVPVTIPVEVPVEVPVERVVERVVYVPVAADQVGAAPATEMAPSVASSPVPTPAGGSAASGEPGPDTGQGAANGAAAPASNGSAAPNAGGGGSPPARSDASAGPPASEQTPSSSAPAGPPPADRLAGATVLSPGTGGILAPDPVGGTAVGGGDGSGQSLRQLVGTP